MLIYVCAVILAVTSVTAIFMAQGRPDPATAASCGDVYDPIPSVITNNINRNKAIYQQVAHERGVPWEVLAAMHYRESNNSRVNPGNDQGIYQLYSIYTTNAGYQALARNSNGKDVSDSNFLEQTRFAADFIQGKAQSFGTSLVSPRRLTTNETNISLIKNTFFSYNGRAYAYANQAATYGFDSNAQPYEGSPYVMNKFDCQRSSMGIITCDGCSAINSRDTRFGAFTLYARLKGDDFWLSLMKKPLPACNTTKVNCVWEFENEDTKRRFYTTSASERDAVYKLNYQPIGVAFHTRKTNDPLSAPVYRLYSLTEGWHFWTTSTSEKDSLVRSGKWRDEGIGFHMDPSYSNTGDPVRRLYGEGRHILTSSGATIGSLKKRDYKDEGVIFTSVSTNVQPTIPPAGKQNIYRFYLKDSHFWTADIMERNSLINNGVSYEGVSWATSTTGGIPAYRLYSPVSGKHFWTTDSSEKKGLIASGKWNDEGIGWGTNTVGTPTYRVYDTRKGSHLWTISATERDNLKRSNWSDEGTAWALK